MTKYKIDLRPKIGTITPVEIIHETKRYLTERRTRPDGESYESKIDKSPCYFEYYDTWKEAHERLCELAADKLLRAHSFLEESTTNLDLIFRMVESPQKDSASQNGGSV